ncbi:MAG: hypothetical protein AAF320_04975 [Myxococcota bacterium]
MECPIYYAANEIEAGCIVGVLRDKGLQSRWYQRDELVQFSSTKQCVIAVGQHDVQQAEAAIRAARADGVISPDGAFVSSSTQ